MNILIGELINGPSVISMSQMKKKTLDHGIFFNINITMQLGRLSLEAIRIGSVGSTE
jgi:hypothetical protein